jgi:hypothetical protein
VNIFKLCKLAVSRDWLVVQSLVSTVTNSPPRVTVDVVLCLLNAIVDYSRPFADSVEHEITHVLCRLPKLDHGRPRQLSCKCTSVSLM